MGDDNDWTCRRGFSSSNPNRTPNFIHQLSFTAYNRQQQPYGSPTDAHWPVDHKTRWEWLHDQYRLHWLSFSDGKWPYLHSNEADIFRSASSPEFVLQVSYQGSDQTLIWVVVVLFLVLTERKKGSELVEYLRKWDGSNIKELHNLGKLGLDRIRSVIASMTRPFAIHYLR